jgi:hypothetical protein
MPSGFASTGSIAARSQQDSDSDSACAGSYHHCQLVCMRGCCIVGGRARSRSRARSCSSRCSGSGERLIDEKEADETYQRCAHFPHSKGAAYSIRSRNIRRRCGQSGRGCSTCRRCCTRHLSTRYDERLRRSINLSTVGSVDKVDRVALRVEELRKQDRQTFQIGVDCQRVESKRECSTGGDDHQWSYRYRRVWHLRSWLLPSCSTRYGTDSDRQLRCPTSFAPCCFCTRWSGNWVRGWRWQLNKEWCSRHCQVPLIFKVS